MNTKTNGEWIELASALGLTPWHEVADAWNAQSGEGISRTRIWQIGVKAEAKLRAGLADLESECTGRKLKSPCRGLRAKLTKRRKERGTHREM